MAVERPISQPRDFLSSGRQKPGKQFIMKEKLLANNDQKPAVPNHLLDTKHFVKLSHNAVIQADPVEVHFAGFEPGKLFKRTLRLINLSSECQQMHVIPPSSRFFKAWYKKRQRLVPGMALEVTLEFTPDEWRYYYDCVRIHCQDEDNLIVPIHGYPVMDTSYFPTVYSFPPTPVLQSKTKEIPLRCKVPVDFEFSISFPQPHPAFRVDPLSGVIPGQGETTLTITFTPTEFSTAVMKLQFNISQFNSTPVVCTVTGNSVPGIQECISYLDIRICQSNKTSKPSTTLGQLEWEDEMGKEAKLEIKVTETSEFDSQLDPHSISPLGVSRKKRRRKPKPKPSKAPTEILHKDGLRFPTNLDAQHSVNSVLNQQAGKMSCKELKEAIRTKNDSAVNRYQLREAEFDQEVKEDVRRERKNELRWQVHLGRDQISPAEREEILAERGEATTQYHYHRGDPVAEMEYARVSHSCVAGRSHRTVGDIPPSRPQFDPFTNDSWAFRHRTIDRFRGAVNKVILRSRAEKKLPLIRKLVKGYKAGEIEDTDVVQSGAEESGELDIPFNISADVIYSKAFPKYTAPDYKDDMAPDALGIVPVKDVPLEVKRQVPFLDLTVPQQYKLLGYKPYSARDAGFGYIPPHPARPLRVGAEDEIIQPADAAWPEETSDLAIQLVPPPGLFKPTDYHPLHIFNPAPGLQVFLPPMPYAETDPDFHLNPLPRYTHSDPANKYGTTLRNFLDREDTIKGVMTWKKFPSQGLVSLANTPTLLNVWVPRWTDPFSKDLLSSDVPTLLDGLPDADKGDIITEHDEDDAPAENTPTLTPSMVNAEFPMISTEIMEGNPDSDDFPSGSKLPTHNNPVCSTGLVPRERREKELELFLQKRNNKLGERIQARIDHMNSLLNDSKLKLE